VSYKGYVMVGKDPLYPTYALQMTTFSLHEVIVGVFVLLKKLFTLIVKLQDRR
jgi:hypothetical protein